MGKKLVNVWKNSGPKLWLAAGILLAVVLGIFSSAENRKDLAKQQETVEENISAQLGTEWEAQVKNQNGQTKEKPQDRVSQTLTRLDSSRPIFDCLYRSMKEGDLAAAATCLEVNRKEIEALSVELPPGEIYLYDGSHFTTEPEGHGIVVQYPSTVFYGTFRDGKPEGIVTAIKSIVLSEARYDYAIGEWRNGRMNGFGLTGYTYYNGPGEEDGYKIEKSGHFFDDKMTGVIRYISIDRTGNSFTWEFEVREGITVLDKRWKYHSSDNHYHLAAENDKTHVYLLSKRDEGRTLWQNRIVWPN